jgi:hypothetical protein
VADFFAGNVGVLEPGNGIYFWRKKNNAANSSYAHLTMAGYTENSAAGGSVGNNGAYYQNGNGSTFNSGWIISPGQGFLVKLAANPTGPVTFTNTMREAAPASGGQPFFKTTNTNDDNTISRLWLNLTNTTTAYTQAMVGYMDTATMGLDYGYDGLLLSDGGARLYSIAEAKALAIQARPSFVTSDVVPMGFAVGTAGQYTITLDHVDGLFSQGQDVYLKDNLLGTVSNLNDNPYIFTTDAGTFDTRFEVVYMPAGQLGNETPELANMVLVYQNNGAIHINAGTAEMSEVNIFDIRGRKIYHKDGINSTETVINDLHIAQEVIIVEIKTDKGQVSKKIVY